MKNLMVALVNPKPGREDEFERWYREVHMRQMVDLLPGVSAARRFSRVSVPGLPTPPFSYLVLYEIDADELESTTTAFMDIRSARIAAANAGTDSELAISDAMDPVAVFGFYAVAGPDEEITAG